nr:DUF1156 domain-containing protein [Thermoanaerobaculia bacterium]
TCAGRPPVNPGRRKNPELIAREWKGAQGLAEDVRYYGKWMRDEAEKRIGHLYPKVEVTPEMAKGRPDLKPYVGKKLTVIAWLWARTVKSPNPAFSTVDVPLTSTFMLSARKGKEAYVEPRLGEAGYRFTVKLGMPSDEVEARRGTRAGKAQDFICLMSGVVIPRSYVREEGKAGRLGARLMAIVVDGGRERLFLSPTGVEEEVARRPDEDEVVRDGRTTFLSGPTPTRAMITGGVCSAYGLTTWGSLFTSRQLLALSTYSDLILEARARIRAEARDRGLSDEGEPLRNAGNGAKAYAEAVGIYLGFCVDKMTDTNTSLCSWQVDPPRLRATFGRQALPMVWDYAEANVFGDAAGDFGRCVSSLIEVLDRLGLEGEGSAEQRNAQSLKLDRPRIVSTDPPYYDNIGYADLSDFFYVWLRRALRSVFPDLFATLAVPKGDELVATLFRHGTKERAESYFLDGMTEVMRRLSEQSHPGFPITIYYAFKQAESEPEVGTASTGWQTFLDAVIRSGLGISGTWPMRSELATRNVGRDTNALASSIVLVCRPRPDDAPTATRREFVTALKSELPTALAHLQRGNIAPVDLAQAAIGPGMAVYTRYSKVLDAEGKPLSVREALALINQTLDESLAEQEGDFDADTRWALTWFEQSGFAEGEYGVAEQLSKSKNTSVAGMVEAAILKSSRGKALLLKPAELPATWDPETDTRLTAWEMVHHLIRVLEAGGEAAAARLAAKLKSRAEVARELAYRLYTICERKMRAPEALSYNALVQSWPEILRLAQEGGSREAAQAGLFADA